MSARKASIAGLVAAPLLVMGAFDPIRWNYRSTVEIPAGADLVSVRLRREIYSRANPGLTDLRTARGTEEIPHVVEAQTGSVDEAERQAQVVNKEVVRGAGLRLTLDLGPAVKHSRIRLNTPERNFRELVRVETSDDNRSWAVVRDDAWIFRFIQDGRNIDVLTIDYPVSTRRYVRVTVPAWDEVESVSGASAWFREARPAALEVVATLKAPERVEETQTKSTRYDLDLGMAGLPHDRVSIDAGETFFHRAIELETSRDGKKWTWLGTGTIYRFPGAASETVVFPETHDRYLRLRIFNQDNRPVDVSALRVATVVRNVVFEAGQQGSYWLYYGNPKAERPSYDLAVILARSSTSPVEVTAGQPEHNPIYQPLPPGQKPWTDRHPGILYAVLAAAVLGMGYITVRFLGKVSASPKEL